MEINARELMENDLKRPTFHSFDHPCPWFNLTMYHVLYSSSSSSSNNLLTDPVDANIVPL